MKFNAILVFLFFLNSMTIAELADHFVVCGNEKQVITDVVTGKEVIFLTDGKYLNSAQYPHNKGWLENDKYVMFESIRPRPDGKPSTGDSSDYRHIERQLLAANVETGDIYHLASLEVEDTSKYGKCHLATSSQYHSDYAPQTNTVVYYDMTGHNLYLLDLDSGQRELVLNMAEGTIGDPPTITDDGTRIVIYVSFPGPQKNAYLAGTTTVIFTIDVDPQTNKAGKPKLVTTWANRLNQDDGSSTNLAHAVINPANKDEIFFNLCYSGLGNNSVEKAFMWSVKADGSQLKADWLTPYKRIHTHAVWVQGRYKYFVDISTDKNVIGAGGVSRYDTLTGEIEKIIENVFPSPIHIAVSEDGGRIVWDTMLSLTELTKGKKVEQNNMEDIVLLDVPTGKITKLAHQMGGLSHPRHIHPNMNRKGSKVVFTVADGLNSRVAVVDISNKQ